MERGLKIACEHQPRAAGRRLDAPDPTDEIDPRVARLHAPDRSAQRGELVGPEVTRETMLCRRDAEREVRGNERAGRDNLHGREEEPREKDRC